MLKLILAGTTAMALAGATLAYAQPGPRGAGGPGGSGPGQHWQMSAEDIAAFGDARIAALKAGLKLTPEQEKNWPAVEAALRDMAKQRSERLAARAGADKPKDPIERMSLRAQRMTQNGAALKKLADAAGPLYQTLDESQKKRFVVLAKMGGRNGADWHRGRHHRDFGGPGERGPRGLERGPMGPDGGPRQQ